MKRLTLNQLICFSVLFIAFSSCRNYTTKNYNDRTGNLEVREWYSRKHLKSSRVYIDKTLKNYIYISYYSDGKLKDSAMYLNDTVEGLRKYYEDGSGLMHSEHYVHGIMNGPHKAEYQSGVTSFEGYRKNNQKVGGWKFHFTDGKPITYEYYDSLGSLKYFRKYDNSGNVIITEGSGLVNVIPQRSVMQTGDTLRGIAEVAVPEGSETILEIEDKSASRITPQKKSIVLNHSRCRWYWVFNDSGSKKLSFTVRIVDKKSGSEETSGIEKSFTVLNKNL